MKRLFLLSLISLSIFAFSCPLLAMDNPRQGGRISHEQPKIDEALEKLKKLFEGLNRPSFTKRSEKEVRAILRLKELTKDGTDLNARDMSGWTALMIAMSAAASGQKKIVELLIKAGADVNAPFYYGETALMYAAYGGELEIVRMLIDAGANVNAQNKSKVTAFMKAVSGHFQRYKGDFNTVSLILHLLIDAGADINAQNFSGDTALMIAVNNGDKECVEFLLESGADPLIQDNYGQTALDIARQNGNQEIIQLLENQKKKLE